ncbi:hypothetical protein H2203_004739 [Taxawa tesnikishii (nom. ined.)]|nr:hypothetical protein H2203_004739 [Dothideales sp. JES 119]
MPKSAGDATATSDQQQQQQQPPQQPASGDDKQAQPPSQQDLARAASLASSARNLQASAASMRAQVSKFTNPQERERWLRDAYAKEVAANGQSKTARRLQSGTWQGAGGGAGIGAATGLGVGTVVGTLVGTTVGAVTAVPTTLVGGGVGAGVGAIKGPFIKLGDVAKIGGVDAKDGKEGGADPAATGEDGAQEDFGGGGAAQGDGPAPKPRKKPRKLEVRNQKAKG